jgi:alkanesulfonate monooxygenase SsuD/methylene tetrahydromethanopterin reductase-like flavin-dependent oxidoreductase (luciferase family)
MRYGFVMPFGDAAEIADAAVLAESAGWDAIFAWEPVWGVDAWVSLTAAAMLTESIRLGTMLTALPRVKPWDLASKVATLDRLSGGRVQLSVGLGAVLEWWTAFEPDQGRATRVELLEEGLAVYDGLMRGQPFAYDGRHYHVTPTDFAVPDPPVQQPRVPVWVVGGYRQGQGSQPSVERAARWDGLLPNWIGSGGAAGVDTPARLAEVVACARSAREAAGLPWEGFDVIQEGRSHGEGPTSPADPEVWAQAGATWWLEGAWDLGGAEARPELKRRIQAGPPGSSSWQGKQAR